MRLGISAKVFLGFAAILSAFGLVTVFGLLRLHDLDAGLQRVSDESRRLARLGAQLDSSFRNSAQATGRLLDEPNLKAREALLRHAVQDQPRIARDKLQTARLWVAQGSNDDPADQPHRRRLQQLLESLQQHYDAYGQAGETVRASLNTGPTAHETAVRQLKAVEQEIGTTLRDLSSELDTSIDTRMRLLGDEERRSALMVLVFSLLAAGVGLVVTALAQRTLRPIGPLTKAVQQAGEGLFHPVPVSSDDELGLLAREFNAMARKLADRDRQLAERSQQLLRSEQLAAVGRLSAQIAHEIRNPLSSLSLNAEMLAEDLDRGLTDPAEARALVRAISREVDRLAGVTEEYLRFSRLPRLQMSTVELSEVAEELADFLEPELRSAHVALERRLERPGPVIQGDPAQLRQALLNLLRNAREAMPAGGRVQLSCTSDLAQSEAVLAVTDAGPGLSNEALAHLWEPFFTTKENGTGLGLPMVQQVVAQHGGRLQCDSVPGQGACFTLRIPLTPLSPDKPTEKVSI